MIAEAILCLALNIYYEARGEPMLGKRAVAYVTVNRSKSTTDICRTVREPNQFSWLPAKYPVQDKEAFEEAKQIAKEVIKDTRKSKDPTSGATYFHNYSVKPQWAKKFKPTLRVGNHIFYKKI